MKKIFLLISVISAFILYSVFHQKSATTAISTTNVANTSVTTSTSSTYKDGTYTGSAANAYYGNIQVQATISDGKITNITFLQSPTDGGHSLEINQQADPVLAQEAGQVQSASVDVVSGTTDSSQAFMQSLQSVLDQTKA